MRIQSGGGGFELLTRTPLTTVTLMVSKLGSRITIIVWTVDFNHNVSSARKW